MILVIGEHRGGKVNPATWEAIAAAQQLAAGQPVAVCVPGAPGAELSAVAGELAKAAVAEVVAVVTQAARATHINRGGPKSSRMR